MQGEHFYEMRLDELLRIQSERHPTRPLLIGDGETLNYGEVARRVDSLAGGLAQLGLTPGERLAILLPNSAEFVISLFAAARAGLIFVPINIRRSATEILQRLEKTNPRAIATFSDPGSHDGIDHLGVVQDLQSELTSLEHLLEVNTKDSAVIAWRDLLDVSPMDKQLSLPSGEPAAIVHSMGITGLPKGAVLSHAALVRNAAGIASTIGCTPEDRFLGAVPYSNTFGLTATILACTTAGACLYSVGRYSPGSVLSSLDEHQLTVHHGVPTMFALELNHPRFSRDQCESLRAGIMSGAPCPPELVRRVRDEMGFPVTVAYGLTEASPSVTMVHMDDGPITATETVGRPMEGVEIRIVDRKGKTLPPGKEGELHVRGYNVMLGYWDDPEGTKQVLDEEGWLSTGDLAVIDADGPVKIVGRKAEVINRAGFDIHPASVEMVLRSYPGVKEAAVVGVPDPIFGELAYACIVPMGDADLDEEQIIAYASEQVASYAVPDRVLFFKILPRLDSGPVRKEYLRERIRIRGAAWKFGKNIDTDAIIPARHCNTSDPNELAKHCMEDADPNFIHRMRRGDLIIADTNFGCGSSREVAPISIHAAGVSAVIAKSFARIFFRNAINIGLPILEAPDAVDGIAEGDEIEVEPATGTIRNLTQDTTYHAAPYPDFLQRIIDRGGLLPYVEQRLVDEGSGK